MVTALDIRVLLFFLLYSLLFGGVTRLSEHIVVNNIPLEIPSKLASPKKDTWKRPERTTVELSKRMPHVKEKKIFYSLF